MEKFFPYTKHSISEEDISEVGNVMRSSFLTQGPKVGEFEKEIAEYVGAKHCVAVSNGTAALHLALLALDIEKGKTALTTSVSFAATSNSILYAGLNLRFCDIESDSANISLEDMSSKIDSDVSLVVPVHMTGSPVDMDELRNRVGDNVKIVEDGCHAFGSSYKCGAKVGSCKFSDMTVFSFHPAKTLTTGEGGVIMTNDDDLAAKLRSLREHGIIRSDFEFPVEGPWYYEMTDLGFNYRLTDIQAALGLSQLKRFSSNIERRQELSKRYAHAFADHDLISSLGTSSYEEYCLHLFVVKVAFDKLSVNKAEFLKELKNRGVGTQVHYIPIYRHPFYRRLQEISFNDFPNSEKYYEEAFSLPFYHSLEFSDQEVVISIFKELVDEYRK